jgi:hypothetical protein
MRRLLPTALTITFLVSGSALAAGKPADKETKADKEAKKEATKHFQKGQNLYDLRQYEDAQKEYAEAYKAKPDPVFLFNIAQCYRQMGQNDRRYYKDALYYYRRYLSKLPNAPNANQTRELIGEVEKKVPAGEVATTTDKPLPEAPPSPVPMAIEPAVASAAKPSPVSPPPPAPSTGEWADVPRATPSAPATDVSSPGTRTVVAESDAIHVAPPPVEAEKKTDKRAYETWWFWTIIGVVVVAAAAGGTGAYVATRKNTSCSSTATWTICVQ